MTVEDSKLSLVIQIDLFNYNKEIPELMKQIVVKSSTEVFASQAAYTALFMEVKKHLNPTKTILRNIHPVIKIYIASFTLKLDNSSKLSNV